MFKCHWIEISIWALVKTIFGLWNGLLSADCYPQWNTKQLNTSIRMGLKKKSSRQQDGFIFRNDSILAIKLSNYLLLLRWMYFVYTSLDSCLIYTVKGIIQMIWKDSIHGIYLDFVKKSLLDGNEQFDKQWIIFVPFQAFLFSTMQWYSFGGL